MQIESKIREKILSKFVPKPNVVQKLKSETKIVPEVVEQPVPVQDTPINV